MSRRKSKEEYIVPASTGRFSVGLYHMNVYLDEHLVGENDCKSVAMCLAKLNREGSELELWEFQNYPHLEP